MYYFYSFVFFLFILGNFVSPAENPEVVSLLSITGFVICYIGLDLREISKKLDKKD